MTKHVIQTKDAKKFTMTFIYEGGMDFNSLLLSDGKNTTVFNDINVLVRCSV